MARGMHACATLVAATVLVTACRKVRYLSDRRDPAPPVVPNRADTLTMITGPYTAVFTTWSRPGPGPLTSHSIDTTLVLQPDPHSAGHFRLGGYEAYLTIHHHLSITAPTGSGTFRGELVIHSDSINLQYARVGYSPGGSWGSGFTGSKTH
jgi:hypothetical protein